MPYNSKTRESIYKHRENHKEEYNSYMKLMMRQIRLKKKQEKFRIANGIPLGEISNEIPIDITLESISIENDIETSS